MPLKPSITGTTPKGRRENASKSVWNLLPNDFSDISWGNIKRKAKTEYPHLSSATIARHLAYFVKIGTVTREERIEKGQKLRYVYYSKISPQEKRHHKETEWSRIEEKTYDEILILILDFANYLANVMCKAIEKKTSKDAQQYVDHFLNTEFSDYIYHLTQFCFRTKEIQHKDKWGSIPVLKYVPDGFMIEEEELIDRWLKTYAPAWIKVCVEKEIESKSYVVPTLLLKGKKALPSSASATIIG